MTDSIPPTPPATCQAAVFVAPREPLEIREFGLTKLETCEAWVRIECCTLCGSDLHTISGARHEKSPSILGHEAIGTLVALGPIPLHDAGGEAVRIGDRITWSVSVSCNHCDRCQMGLPQKCRSLTKYGHELATGRAALSGGLAEYLLLRRGSSVVKIHPHVSKRVICPANCATATIAAALRRCETIAKKRVLILGAGMLGLTAAAMTESYSAASITMIDPVVARLERAIRFGANAAVQWSSDLAQLKASLRVEAGHDAFDVILELSGSAASVLAAYELADVGANVVLVGTVMPSPSVSFDPERIVRRCISLHGVHNYAPVDLQTAVHFLTSAGASYPFDELVECEFPLAKIDEALKYAADHRPFRVAICP